MSKSHPSFHCVFICVWGGHLLNNLIWNRGDLKFNFYFRNEINYYVRHMSFGLARGLKRYKNVKCKNYFKLRISFLLLIEMKCRRKNHFKTVPPPKLTSTEWLSARAYGHFSSSTTNNCTKNTACPSSYTEQQDRWNIYLLSICTGILGIFDILQFEISSLMNWIFFPSLKTNWIFLPVQTGFFSKFLG